MPKIHTKHQEQMLYGSFDKDKKHTPKKSTGANPEKVKARRTIAEIQEQRELDKQFDYF